VTQEIVTPAEAPSPVRPQGRTRPVLPQLRQSASRPRWHTTLPADLAAAFETRRLLVLLPFAMVGGLIAYAGLPREPAHAAIFAAALVLAVIAAATPARPRLQRVAMLALAVALGLLLMPVHGALWGTQMLARPAYGTFEAVVDEILSQTPDQRRIIVSQIMPLEGTRPVDIRRARLVAPAEPALAPGDRIRASLRLARVPGPILPGAFDSQFHAYFAGIGAYGNVTGAFEVVARDESFNPVRSVDGTRRAIGQRVDAVLEGPPAAIAWAMLVGDQSNIDDATRDAMANSGLAHIYSISGLHLSIVAGGIFFITRALLAALSGFTGSLPAKKIAAGAGIVSAVGYLLLAGGIANTPAFRSTLMLVLIFGAVLAGRRALTMRNVALAALVIVLIDPADVFRASFQLSFAAVVALIGVYELPRPPREGRTGLIRRGASAVWVTAWTSLVAGLATLLFAAYHFQQTAPLGVLANVMTLPVLSFVIMPFGVLSVLAMPFGIEQPFVRVLGWGIERMMDVALLVARWSAGLETNPLLTPAALVIGVAALAWFAFVPTRWRFAGPLLALPLILAFGFDKRPDILVADTTQAIAVREGEGMGLLSGRTGSFATEVWSETYAVEIGEALANTRCDSLGCIHTDEEFSIALVKTREAFAEDCARNDLVITRLPAPPECRDETQVLDVRDLEHGGVHWLRWNASAGSFDVRPAIATLDRPWRIPPS